MLDEGTSEVFARAFCNEPAVNDEAAVEAILSRYLGDGDFGFCLRGGRFCVEGSWPLVTRVPDGEDPDFYSPGQDGGGFGEDLPRMMAELSPHLQEDLVVAAVERSPDTGFNLSAYQWEVSPGRPVVRRQGFPDAETEWSFPQADLSVGV